MKNLCTQFSFLALTDWIFFAKLMQMENFSSNTILKQLYSENNPVSFFVPSANLRMTYRHILWVENHDACNLKSETLLINEHPGCLGLTIGGHFGIQDLLQHNGKCGRNDFITEHDVLSLDNLDNTFGETWNNIFRQAWPIWKEEWF